ncbi:MAG: hypothetical protein K2H01_03835 [Ruminococcus sp.]|nr:hypothetical protein [Ruminococcus sp.]
MNRYKRAYYKIYTKTLDILEDIEVIIREEEVSNRTKEKLRKVAIDIKEAHIEGEEAIIKD